MKAAYINVLYHRKAILEGEVYGQRPWRIALNSLGPLLIVLLFCGYLWSCSMRLNVI